MLNFDPPVCVWLLDATGLSVHQFYLYLFENQGTRK